MNSDIAPEERRELEKLSLPDNDFITSYSIASHLVDAATTSHTSFWELIYACQKHISGEKPIPPDELKKQGMAWAYNFNYGKARAKIEKGVAQSAAKTASALSLSYVTFRNFEKTDKKDKVLSFLEDFEMRGIVASTIGYALYASIARESRLSGWLNEIEYPSFAYGWVALTFDQYDWMPDVVHPLHIAFRPRSKAEKIDNWVVFRIMEAQELYTIWVQEKNKQIESEIEGSEIHRYTSSGWNLECLEKLLLQAYGGNNKSTGKKYESWNEVLPEFRANSSQVIMDTSSVSVAKIFYKELNGRLTECYIPYNNTWQRPSSNATSTEITANNIIYKKDHGKYLQRNHICLIRDSGFTSEDGYIQDMRGIAKYSVEDSIRYNRGRNQLGNKMMFIGSPAFLQNNSQDGAKFKVTVSQGFTLLPTSHDLVEKQFSFDISPHINVMQWEENEFLRDTQQYDASVQGRLTSRPNKGEVERVTDEVDFANSAKNGVKFRDYSAVFLTVINKLPASQCTNESDPGYEGKKNIYNIIKKQLPGIVKTDADVNKLLGAVDSFMMEPVIKDQQALMLAINMAETPYGRNRLRRMLLVMQGFPIEEVNITVPLTADKFTNLGDTRIATIENDMFFTTNEVALSGTDDHVIHLEVHLSKNQRVIQGFQQQALKAMDAFKYLENNLSHSMGHLELLGNDPSLNGKAEQYAEVIKQQVAAKKQIQGVADQEMEQQRQAAGQPVIDPETQNKIASENAEAAAKINRTDALAVHRTDQAYKKIDNDFKLKQEKQALDAQVEMNKIQKS
jgi:hypothetical protein